MATVLNIFYQNTRGLRSKLITFSHNIASCDFDLVCITETWLNNGVFTSELFSDNFSVFRRDREDSASKKSDGGGVLIAVRCGIQSTHHRELQSNAEDVWISITAKNNKKIYLCCVYLPPGDDFAYSCFTNNLNSINHIFDKNTVVILGDFNMSQVQWVAVPNEHFLEPINVDNKASNLLDNLSYYEFMQFNNKVNVYNKTLDLIFSNSDIINDVHQSANPIVNEDNYHPALEFHVKSDNFETLDRNTNVSYNFHKADYDSINTELSYINWHDLFSHSNDLNEIVEIFYEQIYKLIKNYVPKCKKRKRFPQYFKDSTIKVIREKNKFHRKWKTYKSLNYYNMFSTLRERSKQLIKRDYDQYINSIETNISGNKNAFWKYISNKRKNSSTIPQTLFYNDKEASNGNDIANLFSSYFQSVILPNTTALPNRDVQYISADVNHFTNTQVSDIINSLDITKSTGPDGIPPMFIKKCATYLHIPLTIIYNKSTQYGIFPDKWKTGYVVPIFKSGDKHNVENYRPITKLSIFGKMLELLLHKEIFNQVKNTVIEEQHGFFLNRSIESNLLSYAEDIVVALDNQCQTDAIYTDFSKAFDKIDHGILLRKLEKVGICGNLLRWIKSYITNRSQLVTVHGYKSLPYSITSGVPQGSHLGPLLFIIYINDIKECIINCKFLLYADDLKIYRVVESEFDCLRIQSDLDRLNDYCLSNNLFINYSKCHSISFTRNKNIINFSYKIKDTLIKKVEVIKDLGVFLDSKWSFERHVELLVNSCNKMLGFISRTSKPFKNSKTCITLYYAFIYSKLNFASSIWCPHYTTYINRIENIQNKFLRFLACKNHMVILNHNYQPIREYYKILTLVGRRKITDLILLYKIINFKTNSSNLLSKINFQIPSHNLRSADLFIIPFRRTNLGKNSPLCRMATLYNRYCSEIDIFTIGLKLFKYKLKILFQNPLSEN